MFGRSSGVVLIVMAMVLGVGRASADDGAMREVGGNVELMSEHPQIEMTSEFVHAWIGGKGGGARVECVFFLHNLGDSTTALIGFPDTGSGVDTSEPVPYSSFQSFVDGVPVTTRFTPDTTEQGAEEYSAWYVKTVHFAAHQTRCIRDTYVGELGFSIGGDGSFVYVLDTGGSWFGNIGVADIVITCEGPQWNGMWIHAGPQPASRKGYEWRWHFADFKPSRETVSGVGVSWQLKVDPLTHKRVPNPYAHD